MRLVHTTAGCNMTIVQIQHSCGDPIAMNVCKLVGKSECAIEISTPCRCENVTNRQGSIATSYDLQKGERLQHLRWFIHWEIAYTSTCAMLATLVLCVSI